MEATFLVHRIRPFSRRRSQEIAAAPKVYALDTGFVCALRGWSSLRAEDRGVLWEHYVLNELQAHLQSRRIHYWRSKHGNEIDFVLVPRQGHPLALECKHKAAEFDPAGLKAFRRRYPEGINLVVAADVREGYARRYGELEVRVVGLQEMVEIVLKGTGSGLGIGVVREGGS